MQAMQALHQEVGLIPRVADVSALKRPSRAAARGSRRTAIVRAAAPATTPKGTVMDDQVELGKTGIKVNSLAIGAWQWGDASFWGFGSYGNYGEDEIRLAYQGTIDAGLNFIDTAEVYGLGKSEKFIRDFQRETNTNVKIATKFAPLPWRFSEESPVKALKDSLQRLNQQSVELYQIHWPGFPVINSWSNDAFCRGMANCQKMGLAKAVGVSNYNEKRLRRAHGIIEIEQGVPLASDQIQFSLLYRKHEKEGLLRTAKQLGVSVIGYSPLSQGLLTGKYTSGSEKPPGPRGAIFSDDRLNQIDPLISLMRDIGSGHGKTVAQVAINWVICKGVIPIVGAKNYDQAAGAAGALGWRLKPDEMAALDSASERAPTAQGLPFENW
ncbi:hypothetical protein WJX74_006595 [Apatococcus lobatus]|uniref:NADP-dependent oxidoreductase domain-containing protein n=1 Tax=Apatococcus lobatus TaxID=904363 RepID=A0AAW1RC94_9CHLO